MQSSKECTIRAIERKYPDRIPICLDFASNEKNSEIVKDILKDYEADIIVVHCDDPEFVPKEEGYRQFGYKMENLGETIGEVKNFPLASWEDFDKWKAELPDFSVERRYEKAKELKKSHPDKYLVGYIGMMMEELINIRGYENSMMDYYEEPENQCKLIDLLYDIGRQMVDGYAKAGMDAIHASEDWGLQYTPMMSLPMWKEFFYDRMKDFVSYIHGKGMKYILHSCGHITYLLDVFVEIGVDVIQQDQQLNMGIDLLHQWQNKLCFFNPVDIQHSVQMSKEELREYIYDMVAKLGSECGGFMYKPYGSPAAIQMNTSRLREEIEIMSNYRY